MGDDEIYGGWGEGKGRWEREWERETETDRTETETETEIVTELQRETNRDPPAPSAGSLGYWWRWSCGDERSWPMYCDRVDNEAEEVGSLGCLILMLDFSI